MPPKRRRAPAKRKKAPKRGVTKIWKRRAPKRKAPKRRAPKKRYVTRCGAKVTYRTAYGDNTATPANYQPVPVQGQHGSIAKDLTLAQKYEKV